MTEQAKAARRAYRAAWAKANPDKVKEQQARYWEKRAAQMATAGAMGSTSGEPGRAEGGAAP